MPNLSIRPINTGYLLTSAGQFLFHQSVLKYRKTLMRPRMEVPVFAFLIQGKGVLALVDTGMAPTEHARRHHFASAHQPEGMAVHEQLKKIGLLPEDIDLIILTHLHWDHSFYLDKFTRAAIYAHEKECAFARDPIPLLHKAYEHPSLGLKPHFEGIDIIPIHGELELMPGISLLETPGHSPGHISVVVETAAGAYLCAGDSILVPENMTPVPELGYDISPPSFFCDIVATWHSIAKQKSRVKDASFVLCSHDPELEKRIRTRPSLGLEKTEFVQL
ncbi:MAG: N-acyl homoserine lactonase family protein [Deltaproteobacteria bacterium]|jgi:glyoxylase-like metal-dependent hydrolase (beta-lactamase superfamily II)|nr:N-acyl homoserine lactonase family protein [Deltaproteobacteria bacterium]